MFGSMRERKRERKYVPGIYEPCIYTDPKTACRRYVTPHTSRPGAPPPAAPRRLGRGLVHMLYVAPEAELHLYCGAAIRKTSTDDDNVIFFYSTFSLRAID